MVIPPPSMVIELKFKSCGWDAVQLPLVLYIIHICDNHFGLSYVYVIWLFYESLSFSFALGMFKWVGRSVLKLPPVWLNTHAQWWMIFLYHLIFMIIALCICFYWWWRTTGFWGLKAPAYRDTLNFSCWLWWVVTSHVFWFYLKVMWKIKDTGYTFIAFLRLSLNFVKFACEHGNSLPENLP